MKDKRFDALRMDKARMVNENGCAHFYKPKKAARKRGLSLHTVEYAYIQERDRVKERFFAENRRQRATIRTASCVLPQEWAICPREPRYVSS